jgi:glycosyltransferase involved in cell wall biosynthesis
VHTAIEAVAILRDRHGLRTELSVAGGSVFPSYVRRLRRLVRARGLHDSVHMLGSIERRNLAALYHAHDVFVFPSTWPEPFSLALLEAMAAGTPVVGTVTGGSGEVLHDGVTGLAFAAGDAADCARAVLRLAADPNAARQLAVQACAQVQQCFTLTTMIDRVEAAIAQAVGREPGGLAGTNKAAAGAERRD